MLYSIFNLKWYSFRNTNIISRLTDRFKSDRRLLDAHIRLDNLRNAVNHKFKALRILKPSVELLDLDLKTIEKSFSELQCETLIISSLTWRLYESLNKRILRSPIDVFVNDCSSGDLHNIFYRFDKEFLASHVVVKKYFTSVLHALEFADEVDETNKKLNVIYCKVGAPIVNLSKMKDRLSKIALHVYVLCKAKVRTVLQRVTNNRYQCTKVYLFYHEAGVFWLSASKFTGKFSDKIFN